MLAELGGFELWLRERGVRRLKVRASHLQDAIRCLAGELLQMRAR